MDNAQLSAMLNEVNVEMSPDADGLEGTGSSDIETPIHGGSSNNTGSGLSRVFGTGASTGASDTAVRTPFNTFLAGRFSGNNRINGDGSGEVASSMQVSKGLSGNAGRNARGVVGVRDVDDKGGGGGVDMELEMEMGLSALTKKPAMIEGWLEKKKRTKVTSMVGKWQKK
jgi:hypothetical protein